MPSARGTYEPPDDIHVFDGSEDDDDVEGSRLPLLIVIALFVLAAFGGVVWMAYTQGVARGHSEAPRTIVAQSGPPKVAANGEGGTTPYKGLKIYEQAAPADEAADHQSAPPPTNPDVNAQAAAEPETSVVTMPPVQTPAETTPNSAASKEPPLSVAKSLTAPAPKVVAPPVPKATPPVVKTVKATPPSEQATSAPAQLGTKIVAAEPPPVEHVAPATGGAYVLQIGAYKSEAEADAAWKTYSSKHAGTLSGRAKDVKQVDLGEKGTWYRLRVGSFADKAAAAALCSKLTAEGGACFPAK
jgi:cell division septation protein DedD